MYSSLSLYASVMRKKIDSRVNFYPKSCVWATKPIYYYIRTKKELKKLLRRFNRSEYRYLHLSCHGDAESISTTLESIPFSELAKLMRPYLRKRRLFISACSAVNHNLAKAIIPTSECLSIIGSAEDVLFSDAAIIWASFYHLMFREDPKKMIRVNILSTLRNVANTFGVSINYFSISKRSEEGYKKTEILPRSKRRITQQH